MANEDLSLTGYLDDTHELTTRNPFPQWLVPQTLVITAGPYPGLWERWWSDRPDDRELWTEVEGGFLLRCLHRTTETVFVTLDEEL
jgi:hypothetical protein